MNTTNYTGLGLNTDSTKLQVKEGQLTFALNALVESWDGERITYQNESANVQCISFPNNLKPVGVYNVTHLNKNVYFLTNGVDSEVGYSNEGSCEYNTLFSSPCLNFNIEYPIHQIVVKITNCSTQVYWTDNFNEMRYFDFDDLPWREQVNPNNDYRKTKLVGQVDCNKLSVQPNFSIPKIASISVEEGGIVKTGSYQFVVQYSNVEGEGYSSFYNASNPVSIANTKISTESFDLPTSKAIRVNVEGLDTSGIYDYFNLVVIETINTISTPKLVGTYPISSTQYSVLYTGDTAESIRVSAQELFQKYQYYDIAEGVTTSDGRIIWYNIKEKQKINYQPIWSKVKLNWVSYKLPYHHLEGYNNPENTYLFKGYMRDEIYPVMGVFLLKNGKQTDEFLLVNREATSHDLETITNADAGFYVDNPCKEETSKLRWQVYNTAINKGFTEEYKNYIAKNPSDNCYKGSYEYGDFAYWESEVPYPNNPDMWGDLAGKPQRHFKLPDELVSKRYSVDGFDEFVYPIGFQVNKQSLLDAIANSDLTQEQKDEIVGFKITRGSRKEGNQSIIAKGMFTNVGKTNHNGQEFLYSNYPYNDLRPDPYFVVDKGIEHSQGYRPDKSIHGFSSSSSFNRFSFHSPDTHFSQPYGIDEGYVKLETIEYGVSKGHFISVNNNAEYKFLTKEVLHAAAGVAAASTITIGGGFGGTPSFDLSKAVPAWVNTNEMFEKLVDYTNFGYMFTSVGDYQSSYVVPNNGFKIRGINYGAYLSTGNHRVESGNFFNNDFRESTVYLNTEGLFLKAHEYSTIIPEDNSRYTISSYTNIGTLEDFVNLVLLNNSIISDSDIENQLGIKDLFSNIIIWIFTDLNYQGDAPEYGDTYKVNNNVFKILSLENGELMTQLIQGAGNFPNNNGTLTLDSSFDPTLNPAPNIDYGKASIFDSGVVSDIGVDSVRDIITSVQSFNDFNLLGSTGDIYEQVTKDVIVSAFNKQLNINNVPEDFRFANINAYYGAVKHYLPAQWGKPYSYQSIDTGYYQNLTDDVYTVIFGGDTYINKFSLKTKLQFFNKTTFGRPDQADVDYKEYGNLGYPMYWLSTKPLDKNFDISAEIKKLVNVFDSLPGTGGDTSTLVKILKAFLSISTMGIAGVMPAVSALAKIFRKVFEAFGEKNLNLDNSVYDTVRYRGLMYLYSYGIPTFFVESQVNVDYRQATNDSYGSFYPKVGTGIPDDWLQEDFVPIVHDNVYHYNQSYSKQNRENYYSHLSEDFDPNKLCSFIFPNRAFWSDKTSLTESLNNWLIYRPLNRFDFPKEYGWLTALNGIQNKMIVARFDNKTQIYNALTTLDSSTNQVYVGSDKLFSAAPPLDLIDTELGSMGSQHKLFLKTIQGIIFIDAKRGQVIQLNGTSPKLISEDGMSKWFNRHLPFQIDKYIANADVDNNFNGIGLSGVYDTLYNRLLLTKLDYIPLNSNIVYENGSFFLQTFREVQGEDKYVEKEITETTYEEVETEIPYDCPAYLNYSGKIYKYENNTLTLLYTSPSNYYDIAVINNTLYARRGSSGIIDIFTIGNNTLTLTSSNNSLVGIRGASMGADNSNLYIDEGNNVYKVNPSDWTYTTVVNGNAEHQGDIFVLSDGVLMMSVKSSSISKFQFWNNGSLQNEVSIVDVNNIPIDNVYGMFYKDSALHFLTSLGKVYKYDLTTYKATYVTDVSDATTKEANWNGAAQQYDCKTKTTILVPVTTTRIIKVLVSEGGTEIIYDNTPVSLDDPSYFKNVSWTLSYNFLTKSWISWHSYLPNYYIGNTNYFQSGLGNSIWNHNKDYKNYTTYYGKVYSYVLEYPFVYKQDDEILQSILDYSSSRVYTSQDIYYEPDELLYFNKAIIYNNQQNSGLLNLIPKPIGNVYSYLKYPKYNINSKDVLISKVNSNYSFNMFWDIVKDKSSTSFIEDGIFKTLNVSNLDYSKKLFSKAPLRAKDTKVRLILDNNHNFKLLSNFITTETNKTYG